MEQEEIKVTTHGLLYRLNSVDVMITTPRTESQEKALEALNGFINKLADTIKNNKDAAKHLCQSYLTACSSDSNLELHKDAPIDEQFQKAIIDCAVDDQKKIRKRLEGLYEALKKEKT